MARTQESYADAMTVRSNQYLSAVRECIAVLPATVLRYETDEFETLTSRLSERESNCDAALRKLRRLCGRATPNFTGVYLQAGAVMELYAAVDEVPNAAEDFVRLSDLQAAASDRIAEVTGAEAGYVTNGAAGGLVLAAAAADEEDAFGHAGRDTESVLRGIGPGPVAAPPPGPFTVARGPGARRCRPVPRRPRRRAAAGRSRGPPPAR